MCHVCSVADPPNAGEFAMLRKQVEDLQDALVKTARGMATYGCWPVERSCCSGGRNDLYWLHSGCCFNATSTGTRTCDILLQVESWWLWTWRTSTDQGDAPVSHQQSARKLGQRVQAAEVSEPAVKDVTCPRPRVASTRVYVMAMFWNRLICCLLDTRCEWSIIGKRCVSGMKLKQR